MATEELPNYEGWSHEDLIKRVTELEGRLKDKNKNFSVPGSKFKKNTRLSREFDPSRYSTRLIALKLAYLGKNYNGFEFHANNPTPLPTIEEELWKALNKGRLIFPKDTNPLAPGEVNWEGCEYSKCGRTDKGVSAFGQVIGIRVRSNRPLGKTEKISGERNDLIPEDLHNTYPRQNGLEIGSLPLSSATGLYSDAETLSLTDETFEESLSFDPISDELPYPQILNRLLPPDIRILAWCPAPPLDFSARFSCRERRYRYFFTQPAFPPVPQNLGPRGTSKDGNPIVPGWMDISAMREAANNFVGLHDFRNFCKVDPSKQIGNFERQIFHADIVEVKDTTSTLGFLNSAHFLPKEYGSSIDSKAMAAGFPKVYSFDLHGSAFLWHQVRHMVAVLFLVGQGLEDPSIVTELLDVERNPRRPTYEMATDTPLVLWDCIFPREDDPERKNTLQWVHVGDDLGDGQAKYGSSGLIEDVWRIWRERKIDEILAGSLMDIISSQGLPIEELTSDSKKRGNSQRIFDGGDRSRLQGRYIPVMKKPKMDDVESINERYAIRKGFESAEDLKAQGFRRLNKIPRMTEDLDE